MEDNRNYADMPHRVPWWFWVVLIGGMAPGVSFPWMAELIQSPNEIVRGLTWLYPAYVIISGFLAWQCYGRRTVMSWIVLILMLLSHACFYYLTFAEF